MYERPARPQLVAPVTVQSSGQPWITFDQFMAFTNKWDQKLADDILTQVDNYH